MSFVQFILGFGIYLQPRISRQKKHPIEPIQKEIIQQGQYFIRLLWVSARKFDRSYYLSLNVSENLFIADRGLEYLEILM